jgi:hypothetical protein
MEDTTYKVTIEAMEKQIEFLKKLQELEKDFKDVIFVERNNKTEILITLL